MTIDWQKNNGLVPCVVQHADSGRVLMMAYMSPESLQKTESSGRVTFWSRSRNELWTKGDTSGNVLNFISYKIDCDGDTLLVQARPTGPVCHTGSETCFAGPEENPIGFLGELAQIIEDRFKNQDPQSSYVSKLIALGADRMAQKVGEEAVETVIASKNANLQEFESEAADLVFHLMVLLKSKGSSLEKIAQVLKTRNKR